MGTGRAGIQTQAAGREIPDGLLEEYIPFWRELAQRQQESLKSFCFGNGSKRRGFSITERKTAPAY